MKRCRNCGYDSPDEAVYCPMCCNTEFDAAPPPSEKKDGKVLSLIKGFLYPASFFASSYAFPFVLAFVIGFGAVLLEALVFEAGFADRFINSISTKVYLLSLIVNLMFIGALVLFFALRRKNIAHEFGFKRFPLYVAPLCAILGYSMQYVLNLIIAFIPWSDAIIEHFESVYSDAGETSGIFITVLSVSIITGFVEELAFRVLPMSRLGRAYGPVFSIIFTSVIFGLAHGTPIAIFYATLLGALMGVVYHRYRSIWPCAIIHMFFNLASVIGLPSTAPTFLLAFYFISFGLAILTGFFVIKGSADAKA